MKTLVAVLLGGFACALVMAQDLIAQPTITSDVARITDVDGEVILSPANIHPKKGHVLKNADQLTAGPAGAKLTLECFNGGAQLLYDRFDAFINEEGAPSNCAIDLNDGTAVATANPDGSVAGSASVSAGLVAAMAEHTRFGITVPDGDTAAAEAFVIQGSAKVTRAGEMVNLAQGHIWYAKSATVAQVPDVKFHSIATNFAYMDAKRAGASVEARTQLTAQYYATFKAPDDAKASENLVESYQALAIPPSAVTKYQAARKFDGMAQVARPAGNSQPPVAAQHPAAFGTPGRFTNPSVDGRRLDLCLHWGVECGAPAADAFCKSKGYSSASSFEIAYDIGAGSPTLVLGDGRVCSEAACDGFSVIDCQ
jgi:hypothetical protein